MKTRTLFSILAATFFTANLQAQSATEILKRTDDAMYAPKDQSSEVKIILIDKKGGQQEREAVYLQKGSEMRLFKFTAPSSQRGISFLSLPGDVMYLYLPAYEKERRIASHVKNQSFAGTDFSYDDMESKTLSDEYDAELLGQDASVWKLKLTPKAGVESDYSRLEMEVRKDNNYMQSAAYYDLGGQKVKQLTNKKIEKIGVYWAAVEMEMTDLVKEHKTIFMSNNLAFDKNLSDEEFTVRKMKQ
jgi:outer membrane lipoprotein-sorting protein